METTDRKTWKELKEKKTEFQKILSVLNRFYHHSQENLTDSQRFREKVVMSNEENLRIFLQKFGKYEFYIIAKVLEEGSWIQDSWIHVDGIQEERDRMKRKGVINHPVFKITCLTDLYKIAEKLEEAV
ncbi:MAG: hypothetical protein N3A69_01815 [Leptospiraceae bacterium]|nr:hypothetical protein [Leptospiraceae bacterium]